MPAIYLFQRRTLYGGDDLHLLALSTSTVRAFQLLCYSILAYHVILHVQNAGEADDDVVKVAAFTATLQDEMYVRRRLPAILPTDDHDNLPSFMNLGISLLEYAWMDSVNDDNCRNSHLFPLLLMSYTVTGVVFCGGSLALLVQIYRTSSQGCPTMHRHPRTETMQQLLEWLFLPINIVHFLIWLTGLSAMFLGYHYIPCQSEDASSVQSSTWFMVVWILAGILLLLSQGIEIFWNFTYVLTLYHHDPHALHWVPTAGGSHHGCLTANYTGLQPLDPAPYENHELVEQMWADRCQNACRCLGMGTCYIFGGRELYGNGAMNYGDFARAMADYLETRGVLDVVPSDILVGFLVLQQVQIQRRLHVRHQVLSEQFSYNNPTVPGFSSQTLPTNDSGTPQLNNHRAYAKSPNGMQLQRSNSQEEVTLLRGSMDVSSGALVDSIASDALLQPFSSEKSSKRPVLLKSMGTGSVHNLDGASFLDHSSSGQNGVAKTRTAVFGSGKVVIDHSLPPASPNPHKALARGVVNANAAPPPFSPKSFQRILSEHNHADVALLEEGARYSKYALAIYTWYLYLYVNPISGLPKLCMKAWNTKKCVGCCLSNHDHATNGSNLSNSPSSGNLHQAANQPRGKGQWQGDNMCEAHKHALLLAANLEEADLVYVQFKSSFNENPYCILLDHETEAVVVAVRGTFSLEDCVTDVLLEPESMEPLGDEFGFAESARGQYCHGGVLACARNVYRDLKRHGSLEYLLGMKYPHYQLRLVGHSLGAATSTMLGFMLRQTYPTLRCFNYSPPGCTVTWDLAIQCQSWCTSFVLDCELVPRMSFEALEYLRDEVLDLIGRIKVSKIEVARRVVTKTLWCRDKSKPLARVHHECDVEAQSALADDIVDLLDHLLLPAGEVAHEDAASTSYRLQLGQFQSIQSERRLARGTRRAIRMFPPGKILHLVKTDEEQNWMVNVARVVTCGMSNAGSLYTPVWIGNGDLNEIVISPTMGTDHFPDRMVEELQGIVKNFGVATHHR